MSGENKMTFALFKYKLGSRLRGSSGTFRVFISAKLNGVYGAYGQTEPPMLFDIYARLSYACMFRMALQDPRLTADNIKMIIGQSGAFIKETYNTNVAEAWVAEANAALETLIGEKSGLDSVSDRVEG